MSLCITEPMMSLLLYTCRRIAVWMLAPRIYFSRFDGARLHSDV